MKKLSALILLSFYFSNLFAQAGVLDSTFGGDGIVTTKIDSSSGIGSILIQPDGKIVAVGVSSIQWLYTDLAIARYNEDGNLDLNFGIAGAIVTPIGPGAEAVRSAAFQPDGKIVIGGYYHYNHDDFALVRYNLNGSLDSTFGLDAMVTTDFSSDDDQAYSVSLQSDGKIVAAGYSNNGVSDDFAIVLYKPDGSPDSSFGSYGKTLTSIGSGNDEAFSMVIQTDGRIIAAGYTMNGLDFDFAVVRYNSDGSLDSSFSSDGIAILDFNSAWDYVSSIDIQPDGKIMVAGGSGIGYPYNDFALARYSSYGLLDSTFGVYGKVTTNIGSDFSALSSVKVQDDGKIIVAGTAFNPGSDHIVLARYNTDGNLDSFFGSNGVLNLNFGTQSYLQSFELQDDGKILLGGSLKDSISPNSNFLIVRLLNDLALGEIHFSSQTSSPLIYPNPIQQTETLEYTLTQNESLSITLYDMNGKLIKSFISNEQRIAGPHKETLNIGVLPAGNYLLTLSNDKQKMTVKVVKQ